MSLQESPSIVSSELSTARRYLREFGVTVNGIVKQTGSVQIKAFHPKYGAVVVFVTLAAVTAEYVLEAVMSAYIERIYVAQEGRRVC